MRRLRELFSKVSFHSFVFLLLVFFGYLQLTKPREGAYDVALVGNLAYLASGPRGLQILDVTLPESPRLVGSYDTGGVARRIAVRDQYAYIAAGRSGLIILNVADPNHIHLAGTFDTPGSAEDVALLGDFAFVADGRAGLQAVNVGKPDNPQEPKDATDFNPGGRSTRILIQNKIGFLADSNRRLTVLDLSAPKEPKQLGVFGAESDIVGIALAGPLAFLAVGTAGLQVVSVEDPAQMEEVGSFDTEGEAHAVGISGAYAYVADGSSGVRIVEVQDPKRMAEVGAYQSVQNAMDLEIRDHRIYLADGFEGLRILDQDLHFSFDMLSPKNQPGNVEDVAVDQTYAFLASESQGVRVLDIRNPQTPREIGIFDTPGQAVAVTRQGDFLYVADRDGGLRILYNAGSTDGVLELAERAHLSFPGEALDVAVNGAFGYVAAASSGLRVVNLEDPGAPREIGAEERVAQSVGVYVEGDFAYVASGASGLHIVNVFDRTKPALISSLDTPGDARAVAVMVTVSGSARTYALVADGDAGLRILDVTDPYAPREVGMNDAPEYAYDVAVSGNLAFVTGRNDGLWIMDISDPVQPREIGFVDTPGEAQGLKILGNNAFVAAHDRGLRIIEVADPTAPREIGFFDVPRQVTDVVVRDDAYLIDEGRGLRVMNVEAPKDPREIGFYDTPGLARGLDVQNNHAYMGTDANLKIVDISNPVAPREMGSFGTPAPVMAVTIEGQYAYVANGLGGLRIVNVSDPAHPASAGIIDTPGTAFDVDVSGSYAYIADGAGGLSIINVSDSNHPQIASLLTGYKDARSVLAVGNYAYLADGVDGVHVLDVSKPAAPTQITGFDTPGIAQHLVAVDNFLFVADGKGGIQTFYILNPANPVSIGAYRPPGQSVAIDVVPHLAGDDDPHHYYIYVASNELGLQIVDASQSMNPETVGLFSISGIYPLGKTLGDIFNHLWAFLTGKPEQIPEKFWISIQAYLFDAFIFVLSVAVFLAFVAQFALPVEKISDRARAIGSLIGYMAGMQGSAVLVKGGKILSRPVEPLSEAAGGRRPPAPGVVMVDASSAVILRNAGAPATSPPEGTVKGPGLVFAATAGILGMGPARQPIWGAADLRPQVRTRPDVRGFTIDGIEVRSNVSTAFTIGETPDILEVGYHGAQLAENIRVIITKKTIRPDPGAAGGVVIAWTIQELEDQLDPDDKEEMHNWIQSQDPAATGLPYEPPPQPDRELNTDRIFSAVFSKARDLLEDTIVDWTELPAHAAAEVFRNILSREVYEELFRPTDPEEYQLAGMRRNFFVRVRNLGVLSYRYVRGVVDASLSEGQVLDPAQHLYYPTQNLLSTKVLRARGIKIKAAGFSELQAISDKVKERLVDRWSADWERAAIVTAADYELQATRIKNAAKANSQREILLSLAEILQNKTLSPETMTIRLFQAFESVIADPNTQRLVPAETIAMLRNLREWSLSGGTPPPAGNPLPPGTTTPPSGDRPPQLNEPSSQND